MLYEKLNPEMQRMVDDYARRLKVYDWGRRSELLAEVSLPFGEELVHYAVGPGTCAVPGLPAGLEALWSRYGRLAWPRLVEPALRLAQQALGLCQAQGDRHREAELVEEPADDAAHERHGHEHGDADR